MKINNKFSSLKVNVPQTGPYTPPACKNCELDICELEEKFKKKFENEIEKRITSELLDATREDITAILKHNEVLIEDRAYLKKVIDEKDEKLEAYKNELRVQESLLLQYKQLAESLQKTTPTIKKVSRYKLSVCKQKSPIRR